jgi:hypothetical protein
MTPDFPTEIDFDDLERSAPEGILSGHAGLSEENVVIHYRPIPLPHYSVMHGNYEVGRSVQPEGARLIAEKRALIARVAVEWDLP